MTPEMQSISGSRRAGSIIALLCGLWLFLSPWVFNANTRGNSYDSWLVGGLIAILAAFELATPAVMGLLSWISCLLAVWIFASAWMFGFTPGSGRFINDLCVGVIVFAASIGNAVKPPHPSEPMPMSR